MLQQSAACKFVLCTHMRTSCACEGVRSRAQICGSSDQVTCQLAPLKGPSARSLGFTSLHPCKYDESDCCADRLSVTAETEKFSKTSVGGADDDFDFGSMGAGGGGMDGDMDDIKAPSADATPVRLLCSLLVVWWGEVVCGRERAHAGGGEPYTSS